MTLLKPSDVSFNKKIERDNAVCVGLMSAPQEISAEMLFKSRSTSYLDLVQIIMKPTYICAMKTNPTGVLSLFVWLP